MTRTWQESFLVTGLRSCCRIRPGELRLSLRTVDAARREARIRPRSRRRSFRAEFQQRIELNKVGGSTGRLMFGV